MTLLNRLSVPHGVHAYVDGRIPHLAVTWIWGWPHRSDPALSCSHNHAFDICTQGEEWCPMPRATWHFRLVKLSGRAGPIRFDYVVAPPP